jgi:hypothetical protein
VPVPEPVVIHDTPSVAAQPEAQPVQPVMNTQPVQQQPPVGVRSPADVLRGDPVPATPVQQQPAQPVAPKVEEPDDEDPFTDILKMFTNK